MHLFLVALDVVSPQAFGENKIRIQLTLLKKLDHVDSTEDMVLPSQSISYMHVTGASCSRLMHP